VGRERDEIVIDLRKVPVSKVLAWIEGESRARQRADTPR